MWLLETNLNVKIGSGSCMHNFISAHWLPARCLSVNKGLDQTTMSCAGKLGPVRLLHSGRGVHAAVALVLFFARC